MAFQIPLSTSIHPWQWNRICRYRVSRNASLLWNLSSDYNHGKSVINNIHQVIANMLCTSNPITDAAATKIHIEQQLHATQWAINSTYHTLKALPAQLVFGWDMIMPPTYIANWAAIKSHKQEVTNAANKENKHHIPHEYHVGEKILVHKQFIRQTTMPHTRTLCYCRSA